MNITCPHMKQVLLKPYNGVTYFLHADEYVEGGSRDSDDKALCSIMNSFTITVDEVQAFCIKRFELTPEFRAAFLTSALARRKVYEKLAKFAGDKLANALKVVEEILAETPHEVDILGEMVGVFNTIIISNLNEVSGNRVHTYDKVKTVPYTQKLSMRGVNGNDVNTITEELDREAAEAERRQNTWDTKYSTKKSNYR